MPPSVVVLSPTYRCNLKCTGCYAYEYLKNDCEELSYEELRKILQESRDMGIYFGVITGGEPLLIKDKVLKLCEEFDDMYFIMYTNGTLIDKDTAKAIERVGNISPCISVEGFGDDTDDRRGKGVGQKVKEAMANMREAKAPFAISVTVTRDNQSTVSSDEFVKYYVDQGAFAGWYFQYMPIGLNPDMKMMPTVEQRTAQRRWIRGVREKDAYPILLMDFWSDAYLSNGCIAAGVGYFHINAYGDIQPCIFTHFHTDNIREKPLKEALNSPFFKRYREMQSEVGDRYRPCGIIDHPEHFRKAIEESGAKPSYPGAETVVTTFKDDMDKDAKEVEEKTAKSWKDGAL